MGFSKFQSAISISLLAVGLGFSTVASAQSCHVEAGLRQATELGEVLVFGDLKMRVQQVQDSHGDRQLADFVCFKVKTTLESSPFYCADLDKPSTHKMCDGKEEVTITLSKSYGRFYLRVSVF